MFVEGRNGPRPVLTIEEKNAIANYVCEITLRGIGLEPSDILNLVQNFLKKDKRKKLLKKSRPSYPWYYGFMTSLQMIGFRSSKHFFQKKTCWINHIKLTTQMKQVSLWGVKLEWL